MIWPRFLFDAETGGAGATPPATPPQPPTGGDTSGGTPGAPDSGGEKITMTPAQLAERLDRAKGAERTTLAKSLGFDTVEAMQQAFEAGKKALDAQKTDAERQAEALRQATERMQALEAAAQQAQEAQQQAQIQAAAFEKMAGKFHDPKAAFKLLDLGEIALKDGNVQGLDEAIEAMSKQYPWTLVSSKEKIAPKIGATNPDSQAAPKESDADRRARYFGGGGNTGFFRGSGVKPEVTKRTT